MTKVQQCGRIPQRDQKYVDIYREKQIRVTVKVLVPVKEHPKVSEHGTEENNKNKFFTCSKIFFCTTFILWMR